jgi:hypothetical protein
MPSTSARRAVSLPTRSDGPPVRVAFAGPAVWLDGCAPGPTDGLVAATFPISAGQHVAQADADLHAFGPDVTVVLDPLGIPALALGENAGVSLGVLVGGLPAATEAKRLDAFDRLVSFRPALTGRAAGRQPLWRAIPPPVSDALFQEPRSLHGAPRVMSVGRSTPHREKLLLPAKHHHDLLQLIHGVSGETLIEILTAYDVGVYVAPEPGGGFGAQVGMHLAAGQLLLTDGLDPAHGLERDIDYLQVKDAAALVWTLDRLARFPEMYRRIRVRGRMKAEQYRSSRLFARVVHDLLADVAAFGRAAV